jgi:hypothetical protein
MKVAQHDNEGCAGPVKVFGSAGDRVTTDGELAFATGHREYTQKACPTTLDALHADCGQRNQRGAYLFSDQRSRPNAFATPAPYPGSALAQLSMWRCFTSSRAPAKARAVLSNSTCRWAGAIKRNRLPGCSK